MKISVETRQHWFEKWALHFIWDTEHDLAIQKIFNYRMSRRLQQMLDDSKSLDREVTLAETFKYTHTLKENKERFLDQQSQDHYETYTQRLEAVTQQFQQSGEDAADGSAVSVVDLDAV
ncbi:uncharacterized protein DS421_18g619620 [Arachis hypogaea]|nr:uncharacterized protein DS421_18g619620 [Arachis hypogaea]